MLKPDMKSNGNFSKMQSSTRSIGNNAEKWAKHYLEQKGLICLYEQYRTPLGEIDLIMRDKSEIVFVEVRYRENAAFGEPHETVNWHKQKRLIRAALYFQQRYSWTLAYNLRIDVVGILGNQLKNKITWIPNAVGVE
jgi:putative endonuclease